MKITPEQLEALLVNDYLDPMQDRLAECYGIIIPYGPDGLYVTRVGDTVEVILQRGEARLRCSVDPTRDLGTQMLALIQDFAKLAGHPLRGRATGHRGRGP